jgi:GNAT superfamily N-acetyltransferase
MRFNIRKATDLDEDWVRSVLVEAWSSTTIVTRGLARDALRLPGLIAMKGGQPRGLLKYKMEDSLEIVSLNSLHEESGVGSALVEAAVRIARENGCRRVWLVTTNDNVRAIRFYESRGFRVAEIHRNSIAEARKVKPEIPLLGINDVPICDEIEMELVLPEKP